MLTFKGFSGNTMAQIEKDVNAFLADHPTMVPSNMQMCSGATGGLYVAILFTDLPAMPQFERQSIPLVQPAPWYPPREITADDPWKGEYYPVGDPPMEKPRMIDPGASVSRHVGDTTKFRMAS